ncbi:MAG: sulfurtransferase [Acidimicrobiales bacterium]
MTLTTRAQHFVSPAELSDLISSSPRLIVLDVRNENGVPDGHPEYQAGHVPGAVYVDLPTQLVGARTANSGAGPLPTISELQGHARSWGIDNGDTVVVYDNVFGTKAGRAWFVLRWAGVKDVRLLDGGYAAWVAGGYPISSEEPVPEPGDVDLSPGNLPVLGTDDVEQFAKSGPLLDARGHEQYAGSPPTPGGRSGHIPGALDAPTRENLGDDGFLLSDGELRERFAALGADGSRPIGLYCGSGVAAAHEMAVLASLGLHAALYVGSFSAWSSDPARPVETGA